MDSLVIAAARALASGDALGALNHVALRDDPPALALRGIAMAQLGDLVRAKTLLRRAAHGFGTREPAARARCTVAEAEIALVSRELNWPVKALHAAHEALERHGDRANAAHARYLAIRRLLLIGHLDEAERLMAAFDPAPLPIASRAAYELVIAGTAIRRLRTGLARAALVRAGDAASAAGIASLSAEVEGVAHILDMPAARLLAQDKVRDLRLDEIEALLASKVFVVDACRHVICHAGKVISLESRPVLFALAYALAEAWPGDAPRTALLARAFRAKHVDESHRARLRVEIGRLRRALGSLAHIDATKHGFVLAPRRARDVAVLIPLTDEARAAVLALLADGEAWSSSALALALGSSQRTVQRALDNLARDGKVRTLGHGRARRWMAPPVPGFPTSLLLPAALPRGLE
ncbi:helix-turn-helix domain-containing protein [uncultured Methylovirgula sp.]|uniref:helix-turn-helix domain-containing protein n=1 Tax=uncultured Methylovirgula sp. TaxID=1285960 RepID=UPI00261FBC5B|nr:helix-turn-helix domain-containing protein [uncultured Methylovirgula sp.]